MRGYLAWDDAHLENDLNAEFAYTRVYREWAGSSPAIRELKCLEVMLPAMVQPAQEGDLLAGRRMFRPLGVAPSYWDDDTDGLDNVSFYADLGRLERVMNRENQTPEGREAIRELIAFWKTENVNAKVRARFDEQMRREMPSDLWNRDSGVIFGLYRLVFSQLDYDRLIRLGLPGLREAVRQRSRDEGLEEEQRTFLDALDGVIGLMEKILGQYEEQARKRMAEGGDLLGHDRRTGFRTDGRLSGRPVRGGRGQRQADRGGSHPTAAELLPADEGIGQPERADRGGRHGPAESGERGPGEPGDSEGGGTIPGAEAGVFPTDVSGPVRSGPGAGHEDAGRRDDLSAAVQ